MKLEGITLYTWLKCVHVVSAIIGVGFTTTYHVWLRHAAREPENELHVVRGIKLLDDRFGNPAYTVLLLSGIGMVLDAHLSILHTFWLATALVLYIGMAVLGLTVFIPMLKRQIALTASGAGRSDEYRRVARRGATSGFVLTGMAFTIVLLMVAKPTL